MSSLSNVSGETLVYAAAISAVVLSQYFSNDDLIALSSLFNAIGGNLSTIIAQRALKETAVQLLKNTVHRVLPLK